MIDSSRAAAGSRRVRPLPDDLIDQIAAGEVVERPASVVKELVENALDAGATRVRVEVRNGGRDWIAVTDDGCGMSPEDARLALQRHATSKIGCVGDLVGVATYGFRGEALPAIASVSQLRLRTRRPEAAEAFEVRLDAGRLREERAAGAPPGTRVEVADLFGAVPARRKFLKTASTEWGHVADWLARAALALPEVHFETRRDERGALVWPATQDLLDRIAGVLGEEQAAALVPVQRQEGALTLRGYTARPDRHRPTLAGVHLFVNQRPVRDRLLRHALAEVYRELLPRGRHPSAVLFLDVPPEAVDVNVHPAKWEVRFADPQAVHRLLRHAVREAVAERRWLGGAPAAAPLPGAAAPRPAAAATGAGGPALGAGQGDWVFAERPPGEDGAAQGPGLPGLALDAAPREPGARVRFGDLRLLGQLLATYLVVEAKDTLLLVDQHAAHERVLYERLRGDWRRGGVESQGLLSPAAVELSPAALEAVLQAGQPLRRLGFDVEAFGADAAVVRAVPALLAERDPAGLLRDLADELAAGGGAPALEAADRLFASLACHSARRKGDVLEAREQRALLDALDAIPWAPSCPHGRPVAVPFELTEIERRFARR